MLKLMSKRESYTIKLLQEIELFDVQNKCKRCSWIVKFCITKLLQGRELFDGQNKCKHINKLWDKTTNGKN